MDTIEIFKLYGSILVDNAKANESIQKTEQKAGGLASKLGGGIATAAKWGTAMVGAAGLVGGALGGVVMKAADAMGEIDDMAQRTGQTAEEFQKYAYAAKLSGMETATLEKAMVKQQKAFADAKEGSKAMSEAYQRMGIDIESVGSSGEAFDLVIKKLAETEDETTRNALANDIFGKSYAELAPLLNQGADGIDKLKQEAVDLGGVMSNESVAAAAEFGDQIDRTKTAIGGMVTRIGVGLMPMINQFLEWVMAHMPEIQAVASKVFEDIGTAVEKARTIFEALWPAIEVIWDFIVFSFPTISAVVSTVFDAVVATIETVVGVFEKVTGAIKMAYEWLTSWNDKDAKPKTLEVEEKRTRRGKKDGTLASGLAYVPYDGYIAELHKGERVLSRGEVGMAGMGNVTINVSGNYIKDDYDSRRIADTVKDALRKELRR